MVNIQSPTAEIRRGKKEEDRRNKERNYRMKIYMVSLLHRATIRRKIKRNPQGKNIMACPIS